MSKIVTATFKYSQDALEALRELESVGIGPDQVSTIMTDDIARKGFSLEQGNKAAEGATIGGTLTGLAAAIAGGLAAVGAVVIPGVNLVASGAFVAALAAGGAGAATGGIVGALIGSAVPENEAKFYEKQLREGSVLLAVEARDNDQKKTVKRIFEQHSAKDIAA